MRRLTVLLALAALALLAAAPAEAGKRKKHKKPAGIEGVVLSSTCYGPCIDPPPPQPLYTGQVTVTVTRAADGAPVATQAISDGRFRFKLKRGFYDVSAVPPVTPIQPCPPGYVCIAQGQTSQAAMIAPCETGETQRVQVRRHRFTHVELHVQNVCIV
jgi:hypothetical protein